MPTDLFFTQPILAKVLARAAALLPRTTTIAALATGHLSLVDGVPWLRTTDLEHTSTERCPASEQTSLLTDEAEDSGPWLLPIARCEATVRSLPRDATIRLRFDGLQLLLTCGTFRATWALLSPDIFPILQPLTNAAEPLTLQGAALGRTLKRVAYAMSDDASRYTLCGIHLRAEGTRLTCTATDGHRLARAWLTQGTEVAAPWQAIVGAAGVEHLLKMSQDHPDDAVTLTCGAQALRSETVGLTLHAQLIDGRYPDTSGLIPTDPPARWLVPRVPALEAVRTLIALSGNVAAHLRWETGEEQLTLSLASDGMEGHADVPCAGATPGHVTAFHAGKCRDLLTMWDGETLTISQKDGKSVLLARCEGDEASLALLMPLRVGE